MHPYDDPLVVAGQGTVALEILEERPDIDCLIVPIGGGGLAAGVATAGACRPRPRRGRLEPRPGLAAQAR